MKKLNFIIDVVSAFLLIVYVIYDMYMGINNHDAYYIGWVIFDFILLYLSVQNIKEDVYTM